jgi:ATP-dependent protease Clp, ATPase subunit
LLNFGFIPEFVGRLPVVTTLAELTGEELVAILTEPKNALTKQYAKLMAMEGAELEFTPDALHELAAQALKKGTGARALRGLIEKLMLDLMYGAGQRQHHSRQNHPAGGAGRKQTDCAAQTGCRSSVSRVFRGINANPITRQILLLTIPSSLLKLFK